MRLCIRAFCLSSPHFRRVHPEDGHPQVLVAQRAVRVRRRPCCLRAAPRHRRGGGVGRCARPALSSGFSTLPAFPSLSRPPPQRHGWAGRLVGVSPSPWRLGRRASGVAPGRGRGFFLGRGPGPALGGHGPPAPPPSSRGEAEGALPPRFRRQRQAANGAEPQIALPRRPAIVLVVFF